MRIKLPMPYCLLYSVRTVGKASLEFRLRRWAIPFVFAALCLRHGCG